MDKCKCGGKKYEYETTSNRTLYITEYYFSICFRCGKFDGKAATKELSELFIEEPMLLLHMIKSGYLVPVNN